MEQLKQKNQSLKIGDLQVYLIQDSEIPLETSLLDNKYLEDPKSFETKKDSVCVPINTFLIKTPGRIVLVDTGSGVNPDEKDSGKLIQQLKEIGIEPNDIDIILITHFHFDHISGLTDNEGNPIFTNSTLYVSKVESDYWMTDLSIIPESQHSRALKYQDIFSPYISNNKYQTFLSFENIADDILAVPAFGHTIGHTVFTFTSKEEELWCIGDLIHFDEFQFKYPKLSVTFDINPQMAINSRLELFKRAVEKEAVIAASHLSGLFKITREKNEFIKSLIIP